MSHYEMFGPAGAGKSTLYSILLDENLSIYGGLNDRAINRKFNHSGKKEFQLLYSMLPKSIKKRVNQYFLREQYLRGARDQFITENINTIHTLSNILTNIEFDQKRIYQKWCNVIERYQIGRSTQYDDEKLLLDEGFLSFIEAAAWRSKIDKIPNNYFEYLPLPEVVIYITAPPEVCLQRQRQRGKIITSTPQEDNIQVQKTRNRLCEKIASMCKRDDKNVNFITVKNTTNERNAIEAIRSEI